MPLSLFAALFVAFGLDPASQSGTLSRSEILTRVGGVCAGIAAVGTAAFLLGRFVTWRVARRGYASSALRRGYSWGTRGVNALTLTVYAAIIREAGWPHVVRSGFGLGRVILLNDLVILLPFLLAQMAGWWGLFTAERALRCSSAARGGPSLGRHLALKGRQTLGLMAPVLLVFSLGQDSVRTFWPKAAQSAWSQPIALAVMGVVVLLLSPVFVRLAWPTSPLPPGPLRDRLEAISRRVGFRCSDILVWDTGHVLVNAGVTGALPWFRYVLLSDALVEDLDPHEVAAVFGHEVGHIGHRHLPFFGFFFTGSLAVLELAGGAARSALHPALLAHKFGPTAIDVAETGMVLGFMAVYFLGVFGHLSRRFERQADVFGCRAVSCGEPDCPPHADLVDAPQLATAPLCPVGIRIFVNALANVAALNGMSAGKRSWRHGSIDRRIAFLEGLEGKPEAELAFQKGVRRLRMTTALMVLVAVLATCWTGSVGYLK